MSFDTNILSFTCNPVHNSWIKYYVFSVLSFQVITEWRELHFTSETASGTTSWTFAHISVSSLNKYSFSNCYNGSWRCAYCWHISVCCLKWTDPLLINHWKLHWESLTQGWLAVVAMLSRRTTEQKNQTGTRGRELKEKSMWLFPPMNRWYLALLSTGAQTERVRCCFTTY